ncbi:hypothetical protein ACFY7A_35635 [Streptomyces longwoodensis]|uniref:hypothetical protein n=1 Tax=Streptomyces longwoodensis TaxID=68231 RepID=UPI0036BC23AF
MTPEEERDAALTELARLRAGLAVGLTAEQSARLTGTTPEELSADAQSFATELGITGPPAPTPRSGGSRGGDVGSVAGTIAAGAAEYARKHPKREAAPELPTSGRNPFQQRTYEMNGQ